jgi:hypothetical protein
MFGRGLSRVVFARIAGRPGRGYQLRAEHGLLDYLGGPDQCRQGGRDAELFSLRMPIGPFVADDDFPSGGSITGGQPCLAPRLPNGLHLMTQGRPIGRR